VKCLKYQEPISLHKTSESRAIKQCWKLEPRAALKSGAYKSAINTARVDAVLKAGSRPIDPHLVAQSRTVSSPMQCWLFPTIGIVQRNLHGSVDIKGIQHSLQCIEIAARVVSLLHALC
jgi:hypothetical protein